MKRQIQIDHNRIFDQPQQVQRYYKTHVKREKKLAKNIIKKLYRIGFRKGTVLDAGCGFGGYTIEMAKFFSDSEFIGIDLSEPLLEIGEKLAKETGVFERVKFLKHDVEKMPFPDGTFDAIISVNMFHHVAHPITMANEIERVLKTNSILLLIDIRRSWVGYIIPPFRTAFNDEEAKSELGRTNLRPWEFSSGLMWWSIETSGKVEG